MRTTLFRILKNGLLVAVALAIFGAMFGQIASMWVGSQTPVRGGPVLDFGFEKAAKPAAIGEELKWRMPLAMAGWGFALVTVFELLAGLWRRPEAEKPKAEPVPAAATEDVVQQFLREAEAKSTNLADTPAPAGLPTSRPSEVVA